MTRVPAMTRVRSRTQAESLTKTEGCQTKSLSKAERRKKRGLAERGSGTVLVLGAGLVLLVLFGAVLLMLQAAVAASRAATAADLSALAAADSLRGLRAGDPCTVAAEVAARNGAELSVCTAEAGDQGDQSVQVATEVAAPLLPLPATGQARAGPPP